MAKLLASRIVASGMVLALAGCGAIEPTEGQMQAAILRTLAPAYGRGVQIEFFDKSDCSRQWGKGYLCHFELTTNVPLVRVNEGLFFYRQGWQVTLSANPKYPF